MTAVASFIISSCLILVSGAANTSVTDVNVTTALQPTNSTDSWRDDLNLTIPTKPQNDSMSLTVPIFLTPTPSPTTNLTTDDESPTSTWETTPSTPSEIDSDEVFNPYPGYYLPTNITLFPTTQNQNQSRPLPTTSYIASTPPPTPTMTISTTSPNPAPDTDTDIDPEPIAEPTETTSAAASPGFDKSYFRLLMVMYLGTFTLILIYIVKE